MKKTILLVVIVLMFGWTLYEFISDSDQNSEQQDIVSEEEIETDDDSSDSDDTQEDDVEVGLNAGQRAPDFNLTTLMGDDFQLSDYRGKRVMLNFWGTWCPPCRAEMPDMERLYQEHDIDILAVNLTTTEASVSDVSDFIDEFDLTFTIPMDEDNSVSDLYRIQSVPTTYMIDSEGIIHQKAVGALNYQQMVGMFEEMD